MVDGESQDLLQEICLATVKVLLLISFSLHQKFFIIQNILIFCEALSVGGAVEWAVMLFQVLRTPGHPR